MAVVLDTSIVLGLMFASDRNHRATVDWVQRLDDDLVTSPLAVAEMDYFVGRYGGREASEALWDNFEAGAYTVRWWADALVESIAIARANPEIGLADASLVAVAGRAGTNRIATFDHRHFRTLTTRSGDPFVVLPADAS